MICPGSKSHPVTKSGDLCPSNSKKTKTDFDTQYKRGYYDGFTEAQYHGLFGLKEEKTENKEGEPLDAKVEAAFKEALNEDTSDCLKKLVCMMNAREISQGWKKAR